VQSDTSRNIRKLCQYIETKRGVESKSIFLQSLVKSYLLLLLLVQWQCRCQSQDGIALHDIIGYCVTSRVWSYCLKYCLPDWVPIDCEIVGCTAKANFSSPKLLREVIVAMSSSCEREMTLQDLSLSLGLLDSNCLSLTISECTHIISPAYYFSRFSCQWNKALGFLLFSQWIDWFPYSLSG